MNTIWKLISIASFALMVYQVFARISAEGPQELQIEEFEVKESFCYISEEMPRFPGCENIRLSKRERQSCADKTMLEFVYSNLQYQSIANHFEGTAVVQFTVEKDGHLSDIEIKKGLVPGLGKDIVNVVKKMPKWIPGKQAGKLVRIRYTLPVKIRWE